MRVVSSNDSSVPLDLGVCAANLAEMESALPEVVPLTKAIMLFGRSGAAKTTTLLALMGEVLEKDRDKIVCRNGTQSWNIGTNICSTTKGVHGKMHKGFLMLDTAGIIDTEGPSRDIPNILAVQRMLKSLSSVIPVLVIPYYYFKLKHNEFTPLLDYYSGLFGNDQDAMEKTCFFITHIPADHDPETVSSYFEELASVDMSVGLSDGALSIAENFDLSRTIFFDPLCEKTIKKAWALMNRMQKKPVTKLSECQFSLPPAIKLELERKLKDLNQSVTEWAKQGNTDEILKTLNLLTSLGQTLEPAKEAHSNCLSQINQTVLQKQGSIIARFTEIIQVIELWSADVNEINSLLNLLQKLECLNDVISREIMTSKALETFVWNQLESFCQRSNEETNFDNLRNYRRKMEQFAQTIILPSKDLQQLVNNVDEVIQGKVQKIVNQAQCFKITGENADDITRELNSLCSIVDSLQNAYGLLGIYLRNFPFEETRSSTLAGIISVLSNIAKKFQEELPTVSATNVETLTVQYLILKVASNHIPLQDLVGKEQAKQPYQAAKKSVIDFGTQKLEAIQHFSESARGATIQNSLIPIKLICTIDSEFDSALNKPLFFLLSHLSDAVEKNLGLLESEIQKSEPDYVQLHKYFVDIKAALWMDSYPANLGRIQEKVNDAVRYIHSSVRRITAYMQRHWDARNYTTILEFIATVQQLERFGECDENIRNEIIKADTFFSNVVKECVNNISTKCTSPKAEYTANLTGGEDEKEILTFSEAGRLSKQLKEIQNMSINLGFRQIYETAVSDLADLIDRKIRELKNRIHTETTNFRLHAAILAVLEPVSKNANFEPSIQNSFNSTKQISFNYFSDAINDCKLCIERKQMQPATDLIGIIRTARVLTRFTGDGDIAISEEIRELERLFMQNVRTTVDKIPIYLNDNRCQEVKQLIEALPDQENAILALKQDIFTRRNTLLQLVNTYIPVVDNRFDINKYSSILDKITFINNLKSVLPANWVDSSFDLPNTMFEMIDDVLSTAVKDNINRHQNGQFEVADSIHSKINTAASQLSNVPKTKGLLADYIAKVETLIQCSSESSWLNLNNLYSQLEANQQSHLQTKIIDVVREKISNACNSLTGDSRTKLRDLNLLEDELMISLTQQKLKDLTSQHVKRFRMNLEDDVMEVRNSFQSSLVSLDFQSLERLYQSAIQGGDFPLVSYFEEQFIHQKQKIGALLQSAVDKSDYRAIATLWNQLNKFAAICPNKFSDVEQNVSLQQMRQKVQLLLKSVLGCSNYDISSTFPQEYFPNLITLLSIYSIPNLNALNETDVLLVTKPLQTILDQIGEFVIKGQSQFDFQNLNMACDVSKNFSAVIESLHQISLENGLVLLRTAIDRAKPYPELCLSVQKFLATIPEMCVDCWNKNKDTTPMDRSLTSINRGHLQSLSKHIPNAEKIAQDIKAQCLALYESILHQSKSSFALSSIDFNQNFSDLKKFATVERQLGFSGLSAIEDQVVEKITQLKDKANQTSKIEETALALQGLQQLADEVPMVELIVFTAIEDVLQRQAESIDLIADYITENPSRMGNTIIQKHAHFAAAKRDRWLQKTVGQTIEKSTEAFQISDESANIVSRWDKLFKLFTGPESKTVIANYNKFVAAFKEIVEENKSAPDFDKLEQTARSLCSKKAMNIPAILANVLAVWSLLKSNINTSVKRTGSQQREYWYQPHAVQVLTLFRMLETRDQKFINQLVQILTGEGKSVILGTLCTIFALKGLDVNCICYSQYLSERDYSDFLPVFEKFHVTHQVKYSTIAQMCELIIKKKGNVREHVNNFLESKLDASKCQVPLPRDSILLIDEVDVFFGMDFFGNSFNPATRIINEHSFDLMQFIWRNKTANISTLTQTPAYHNLVQKFPKWEGLIKSEISKMLVDVNNWSDHNPIALNGRIGYAIHGDTSFTVSYGYKTAFAYFHFNEKGDIPEASLKSNVGIIIVCGSFSYAEIPRLFTYVMGVSGTLSNLTSVEKQILASYGINRVAIAPSMYGESRRVFAPGEHVKAIEDYEKWLLAITQSANDKVQAGRAVIIIFEKDAVMRDYIDRFGAKFANFQILEERSEFKTNIIERATKSGMVTAISRSFARGSDFSCQDNTTTEKGGVHVIQAFISESAAEHIQAQGRTARQGEPGSYEMILWEEDLINYGIPKQDITTARDKAKLYELIFETRDRIYETLINGLISGEKLAKASHDSTMQFYEALVKYTPSPQNYEIIQNAILSFNSVTVLPAKCHFYFCLDDSGSMKHDWNNLVNGLVGFIQRRLQMCANANVKAEDLVTIVNYSSTAQVMCSGVDINSQPQNTTTFRNGGTDFAVGLNAVAGEMQKLAAGYQPVLIFMSDGGSSTGDNEIVKISKDYKARNITIYLLGFGRGCSESKLKHMAKISGGEYYFGNDAAALKAEFEAISTKVSSVSF